MVVGDWHRSEAHALESLAAKGKPRREPNVDTYAASQLQLFSLWSDRHIPKVVREKVHVRCVSLGSTWQSDLVMMRGRKVKMMKDGAGCK